MKNLNFILTAVIGVLLIGCARQNLIKQNAATARELVGVIRVYDSMDITGKLPKTLNGLVSAHLIKEVPQCKCADGKLRDFIYISGYDTTIDSYVILASPPEMDSEVTIVAYMNAATKVLPREEAAKEIEKSRALIKSRQEESQAIKAKSENK
jgi:hypothetical protein